MAEVIAGDNRREEERKRQIDDNLWNETISKNSSDNDTLIEKEGIEKNEQLKAQFSDQKLINARHRGNER